MAKPALSCSVILTSASTRSDGSLGLRFCTPELSSSEKTAIFDLQNCNLKMLLQPVDETPAELKEVRGQFETRTPSQRLRALIYVHWKQASGQGEFDEYYRRQMETIIESWKQKLEQK